MNKLVNNMLDSIYHSLIIHLKFSGHVSDCFHTSEMHIVVVLVGLLVVAHDKPRPQSILINLAEPIY